MHFSFYLIISLKTNKIIKLDFYTYLNINKFDNL